MNRLYDEFAAMLRWNMNEQAWFALPRETRAMKMAFLIAQDAVQSIRDFDALDEARRKKK